MGRIVSVYQVYGRIRKLEVGAREYLLGEWVVEQTNN